jgi:hypothetical protein
LGDPVLEIAGASVVCLGSFNPQILQPAWLAGHDLLREQESENAKIGIVHPDVIAFETEWLTLEVTRDRFAISTLQEPYDSLRDLLAGVLTLLPHTPVEAVGLNLSRHYRMQSEETWHELGHRLAPPENWSTTLTAPGMRSLTMQGQRTDGRVGHVRIQVEPSGRVPIGVYISTNDHYQRPGSEQPAGALWVIELLKDKWMESYTMASQAADSLLGVRS